MLIRIGFEIEVRCTSPAPLLMALSIHPDFPGRILGEDKVRSTGGNMLREYRDGFNNRISRTVSPIGTTVYWSDCISEVSGLPDHVPFGAKQHEVDDLPEETLNFLIASRYCDSDKLGAFAWEMFGTVPPGWSRVQAVADFVHNHVKFGYKFGRHDKTAFDAWNEGNGVCRDYAHLGIALCRALNIPARYVSGYLGDIGVPDAGPDDFCAWFEVFLEGRWHTVDARYNVPRIGRVVMVRGTDASDVAMVTSFGKHELSNFRVWTIELDDSVDDAQALAMLESRPGPKYPAGGPVIATMASQPAEITAAGS